MKIGQLFHVKNVCKNVKIQQWKYGLFGHNYRVAALSSLYLAVLGIIIPCLKLIGQFRHTYINNF